MEDSRLLRLQSQHRSSNITNEELTCKHRNVKTPEHLFNSELADTGFDFFCTIESFKIDPSLITALVERWRPETHTFHLPSGECTITLEDVSVHLGLVVDGLPVTGPSCFDWRTDCQELLGRIPEPQDMKGYELKLSWITNNFYTTHPVTRLEKEQCCRAHILNLIGSVLLLEKSNNLVHLMYLPLLRDLKRVRQYSWGSACLAHLYTELTIATRPKTKSIAGCLMLLQSWIWCRLPMFASVTYTKMFPFANSWSQVPKKFTGIFHGNLRLIRTRLDHMKLDEFSWTPYISINVELLQYFGQEYKIWKGCVPLICFSTIVWHHADRVKLQFTIIQEIPRPPMNMDKLYDIDKRGNYDVHWGHLHAEWINLWEDRLNRQVDLRGLVYKPIHTTQYMRWYVKNSLLYLSPDNLLTDPRRNMMNARESTSTCQVHQDTPGCSSMMQGHLSQQEEPYDQE